MGVPLPSPPELEAIVKTIEGSRPEQDHIPVSQMSYSDSQLARSMVGGISTPRVWATTTTPESLFDARVLQTIDVVEPTMAIAEGIRPDARAHMESGKWHPLNSALVS